MIAKTFTQARLLAKITGLDADKYQEFLLPNNFELSRGQLDEFEKYNTMIAYGFPLDYILSEVEFCGQRFIIDPRVLIPRPETEAWVESFTDRIKANPEKYCDKILIDVGCGSGVIGLSLAKYFKRVVMLDLYQPPLENTRKNVERLGAENVDIYQSNLLEVMLTSDDGKTNGNTDYYIHYSNGENEFTTDIGDRIDYVNCQNYFQNNIYNKWTTPDIALLNKLIKKCGFVVVANLPYVPEIDRQNVVTNKIQYEPAAAIFSGDNGLLHTKQLLKQLDFFGVSPMEVHLEIDIRSKK
jgi:methylase of polypeptide subunit release factors